MDKFPKGYLYHDANKNPTGVLVQIWDGSAWLNYFQSSIGYDANNFMKFLVWKDWEMDGTTLSWGDSTYIYYHTVVTGMPGLTKGNVVVYPNPSKGRLSVTSNKS